MFHTDVAPVADEPGGNGAWYVYKCLQTARPPGRTCQTAEVRETRAVVTDSEVSAIRDIHGGANLRLHDESAKASWTGYHL